MIKKKIAITTVSLTSLLIFLSGCSGSTVTNTANISNSNQAIVISNANTSMNTNVAANMPTVNVNGTSTTNGVNSSSPNSNSKPVQTMKEPTPQIGSGASDFELFTRARSAIISDKELLDIIIEVKEGNITLSGKVSGDAQKAKAEQLIKVVSGVKSVRNNINVSK